MDLSAILESAIPVLVAAGGITGLLDPWQGHLGIGNRVHYVRDVILDEDRSQVRTGATPRIMTALRNMTISLPRMADLIAHALLNTTVAD